MSKLNQLREQKAEYARQARNMMDNKGDAVWTKDEQAKYDDIMNRAEDVDRQISNEQKLLDVEAGAAFNPSEKNKTEKKDTEVSALFNKWIRRGPNALTVDDWNKLRNAATQPDESGGYTVQTEIGSKIITAISTYGNVRKVATSLKTQGGNPISFPTFDGKNDEGELVPESSTSTDDDIKFGTAPLNVYKFGSKIIPVSMELIQDSAFDIEAFIIQQLGERIGKTTSKYFTTGTGDKQPFGIVTTSKSAKVGSTGSLGTITYDDLVDIQDALDEGYGEGSGVSWMLKKSTRTLIRKLKDTNGRPIFVPGYDSGITGGVPDELLGSPIVLNSFMPAATDENQKSIIYGQLSAYHVRDALEVTMFRFSDSAFVKNGQIGFLAWARSGGNLMDKSAVVAFQNAPAAG